MSDKFQRDEVEKPSTTVPAGMNGSKSEMLTRLQLELDAMRGRGETARLLALKSETLKDSLTQHAENIEQAAASLEAFIRDIQKAWNTTASSDGSAA
jgi:hypothetical protein